MKQIIEKKINFILFFIICVVFLYASIFILSRIEIFFLQIIIVSILVYLLLYGIYLFMPIYEYVIDNHIIIIRRVFSQRYFDEFRIAFKDIEQVEIKENYPVKFWNVFFLRSQNKKIYTLKTKDMTLYIKPNEEIINELKKDDHE